jgi:hypothetical protein
VDALSVFVAAPGEGMLIQLGEIRAWMQGLQHEKQLPRHWHEAFHLAFVGAPSHPTGIDEESVMLGAFGERLIADPTFRL